MKGTIYFDGVAIGEVEAVEMEIEYDVSCEKHSSNLNFFEGTFGDDFERFPEVHNRLSKFFKSVRLQGKDIVGSY